MASNAARAKERKEESFLIKVSAREHDILKKAAKILGTTKSEFVLGNAVSKAQEVLGSERYSHLEEREGILYFKGRNLRVFDCYYLMKSQNETISDWCDIYVIPPRAMREAESACTVFRNQDYEKRVFEIMDENQELQRFEPRTKIPFSGDTKTR